MGLGGTLYMLDERQKRLEASRWMQIERTHARTKRGGPMKTLQADAYD